PLEVLDRHLAGAEPVEADAVLELVQALVDLGVEIGGRNHDAELAPQSFIEGFRHLHGGPSCFVSGFDWEHRLLTVRPATRKYAMRAPLFPRQGQRGAGQPASHPMLY